MAAKRHKLELNPLGDIREYNDEIGSRVIRVVDVDFLFNRMLKHIPVKYDEKTKTIEFLYLGKLYFIDYSDDLKKLINNKEYNEYYEFYKKKMNIKINESVIMHYDFGKNTDELSKIALLHKALEEEYNNTSAKASRNIVSLSLSSFTALACFVVPYSFLRTIGVDIHVSLAVTGLADFLLYIISFSNGNIDIFIDTISNIKKYYKEKNKLKYKLDEVDNHIDSILKLKDLDILKDDLLNDINDVVNKINELSRTRGLVYSNLVKKIVKNYLSLCNDLVYDNISIEHYNNIVNRYKEAINDIKIELNSNVHLGLKI